MIKIGITGGIGSGKTTVCKVFEILGIPVFYADDVAKSIMIEDPILINDIRKTFGEESYFDDGSLNRKHISAKVFNNDNELSKLNALVHPAVFRAFDKWDLSLDQTIPYNLKEAALLFESGSYKMCDYIILVTAPKEVRIKRVMQRDGVTAGEVQARIDKQLSDEEKRIKSQFVIINDGQQSIIEQVYAIHQQILAINKNKV